MQRQICFDGLGAVLQKLYELCIPPDIMHISSSLQCLAVLLTNSFVRLICLLFIDDRTIKRKYGSPVILKYHIISRINSHSFIYLYLPIYLSICQYKESAENNLILDKSLNVNQCYFVNDQEYHYLFIANSEISLYHTYV